MLSAPLPNRAVRRVVSLGKTLLSHCLSPPGVQIGADEFNALFDPAMDKHPIQRGVEIGPVASSY